MQHAMLYWSRHVSIPCIIRMDTMCFSRWVKTMKLWHTHTHIYIYIYARSSAIIDCRHQSKPLSGPMLQCECGWLNPEDQLFIHRYLSINLLMQYILLTCIIHTSWNAVWHQHFAYVLLRRTILGSHVLFSSPSSNFFYISQPIPKHCMRISFFNFGDIKWGE